MENSQKQNIFTVWFFWHYYETPMFLFQVFKNYILFGLNYFSMPILLKSFFAPWRKYRWNYPQGINVLEFFNTLISNGFSRILGAGMRIILIFTGIVFQIFIVIAGITIFLLWLLLPFIAIAGFLFAFIY